MALLVWLMYHFNQKDILGGQMFCLQTGSRGGAGVLGRERCLSPQCALGETNTDRLAWGHPDFPGA